MNASPISYILTGAIALILSWTFSGCRWGNHVVEPQQGDGVSGEYATEPVAGSLKFCVTHASEVCTTKSNDSLPDLMSEMLPDPTLFVLDDASSGSSELGSSNVSISGVTLNPDHTFQADGYVDPPAKLWDDPACTYDTEMTITGALVSGRMQAAINVTTIFTGTCGPSLTKLQQCYEESLAGQPSPGSNCTDYDLSHAAEVVGPFVDARVLSTTDDFSTLQSLSYSVSYL